MNRQLVFTICLLFATFANITSEKLSVTVLYESLCPACRYFITHELAFSYEGLKDWINITLVPYGNTYTPDDGKTYRCQHGPNECKGDLVQLCTQNEIGSNQDLQVEYTVCQMQDDVDVTDGRKCAEKVGVSYSKVEECINSSKGAQLTYEAYKLTKHFSPSFAPAIIFNNVFDETVAQQAYQSFEPVVCKLIKNAAPACHEH